MEDLLQKYEMIHLNWGIGCELTENLAQSDDRRQGTLD